MPNSAHNRLAYSILVVACSGPPERIYEEPEAADGWTIETIADDASHLSMARNAAGALRIAHYNSATRMQSVSGRSAGWQSESTWRAPGAGVLVAGADDGFYLAAAHRSGLTYGRYEGGSWQPAGSIDEGAVEDVLGVSMAAGETTTIVSYAVLQLGPTSEVFGPTTLRAAIIADGSTPDISTIVEFPSANSLLPETRVLLTNTGAAVYFLDREERVNEARLGEEGWTAERILDARSPLGCSATTDANGDVHLVTEVDGPAVLYLRRDTDGWRWEDVGAAVRPGGRSSSPAIAIGPDGTVHLSYVAASESELWYARLGPEGWEHELVGYGSLSESEIVVASDLAPHIAFTHCRSAACSVYEARPSTP